MKSPFLFRWPAILLLPTLLLLFLNSCSPAEKQKPNVLMIVVDDMNGYAVKDQFDYVKAPYLDDFRNDAVNFVNAACNTPVCYS